MEDFHLQPRGMQGSCHGFPCNIARLPRVCKHHASREFAYLFDIAGFFCLAWFLHGGSTLPYPSGGAGWGAKALPVFSADGEVFRGIPISRFALRVTSWTRWKFCWRYPHRASRPLTPGVHEEWIAQSLEKQYFLQSIPSKTAYLASNTTLNLRNRFDFTPAKQRLVVESAAK